MARAVYDGGGLRISWPPMLTSQGLFTTDSSGACGTRAGETVQETVGTVQEMVASDRTQAQE